MSCCCPSDEYDEVQSKVSNAFAPPEKVSNKKATPVQQQRIERYEGQTEKECAPSPKPKGTPSTHASSGALSPPPPPLDENGEILKPVDYRRVLSDLTASPNRSSEIKVISLEGDEDATYYDLDTTIGTSYEDDLDANVDTDGSSMEGKSSRRRKRKPRQRPLHRPGADDPEPRLITPSKSMNSLDFAPLRRPATDDPDEIPIHRRSDLRISASDVGSSSSNSKPSPDRNVSIFDVAETERDHIQRFSATVDEAKKDSKLNQLLSKVSGLSGSSTSEQVPTITTTPSSDVSPPENDEDQLAQAIPLTRSNSGQRVDLRKELGEDLPATSSSNGILPLSDSQMDSPLRSTTSSALSETSLELEQYSPIPEPTKKKSLKEGVKDSVSSSSSLPPSAPKSMHSPPENDVQPMAAAVAASQLPDPKMIRTRSDPPPPPPPLLRPKRPDPVARPPLSPTTPSSPRRVGSLRVAKSKAPSPTTRRRNIRKEEKKKMATAASIKEKDPPEQDNDSSWEQDRIDKEAVSMPDLRERHQYMEEEKKDPDGEDSFLRSANRANRADQENAASNEEENGFVFSERRPPKRRFDMQAVLREEHVVGSYADSDAVSDRPSDIAIMSTSGELAMNKETSPNRTIASSDVFSERPSDIAILSTDGDLENDKETSPSRTVASSEVLSVDQFSDYVAQHSQTSSPARSEAQNDSLSDLPSDVDSEIKERYLFACKLLKEALVKDQKDLSPSQKSFFQKLLVAEQESRMPSQAELEAAETASAALGQHSPDRRSNSSTGASSSSESRISGPPDIGREKMKEAEWQAKTNSLGLSPKSLFDGPMRKILSSDQQEPLRVSMPKHPKDNSITILGKYSTDPGVLTQTMMEGLQKVLPKAVAGHNFWLKFSSDQDTGTLSDILPHIKHSRHTIVGVETTLGDVFGAFCSSPWRTNSGWFGSETAFLWKLKTSRRQGTKCKFNFDNELEIYPYMGNDGQIQYCTSQTLAVGGGERKDTQANEPTGIGFMLDGDLMGGESSACPSFGSPSLCGNDSTEFDVATIEIWTLTPYTNIEDGKEQEKSISSPTKGEA